MIGRPDPVLHAVRIARRHFDSRLRTSRRVDHDDTDLSPHLDHRGFGLDPLERECGEEREHG